MSGKRNYDELRGVVAEAGKKIEVGGRYRHPKSGGEYEVVDLVLIEADEEVGVVYEAVERRGLRWLRTVENFCEEVEVDGARRKRFEKI